MGMSETPKLSPSSLSPSPSANQRTAMIATTRTRLQERLQSSEAISRMSNTLVEWERGWQGIRAKASEELARAQKAAEEGMRKASLSLQEKGILEPSQEYRGQGSSTENTGTKESKA